MNQDPWLDSFDRFAQVIFSIDGEPMVKESCLNLKEARLPLAGSLVRFLPAHGNNSLKEDRAGR